MKINNIIVLKCVPITKKWANYTYLRFLTLCAVSTTTVLHIYTKVIYYAKVHDKLCMRTYRLLYVQSTAINFIFPIYLGRELFNR